MEGGGIACNTEGLHQLNLRICLLPLCTMFVCTMNRSLYVIA